MSYPTYKNYKDSGVEWLGEVPNHWAVVPIKSKVRRKSVRGFPEERLLSVYRDYGVITKDSRNDNHNRPSDDLTNNLLVNPGDLVFNKMKVWQGSLGVSRHRGIVSPAYYVCDVSGNIDSNFLHYLLRSATYIPEYKRLSSGIRPNQWDLDWDAFRSVPILIPKSNEQKAIAIFLDRETAKIDKLIAAQERLIKLLEEKRQATISHIVTKGLNPDVPMKDSGIDWLGEVPSHWGVKALKYIAKPERGKFTHRPRNDPAMFDGDYPFVQTGDVSRANKYLKTYSQTLNNKGKACSRSFSAGTVLIAIAANLGSPAILEIEAYCPDSVIGFIPKANLSNEYLFYISIALQAEFERVAIVSTQANLNIDRVGEMIIALPSLEEQIDILKYMNKLEKHSNDTMMTAKKVITKLKEKRSALISAAVTGKIDVRGLVDMDTVEGGVKEVA